MNAASSLPPLIRDALVELRARLTTSWPERVESVVLFGSWARGEATEDSDVDVLVVLKDATSRERLRAIEIAAEVGFEHRLVVEAMVVSSAQWSELHARERLIASEIQREGIEVGA